jgi:acetolactate synthase-1/2/3 large subunit
VAHGYAKAAHEPMAVILHDLVGLLHGAMGIYYAYIDRAPVFVLGGAGPMALERRRPNIDWIHTANVQGDAVRDFTKWDDQPASQASVPETLARAHRIAVSEPCGPVYVALDAALQEAPLDEEVPPPDFARLGPPSRIGPDPAALERLAERLVAAERPVLVTGYAGRDPGAFEQFVELAELLAAGVIETGIRLSFPNRHPLNASGAEGVLEAADAVCFLDVKDMGKPTQALDSTTRRVRSARPGRRRARPRVQRRIARRRGTPVENAFVGMELDRPAPDFAGVARSLGWWATGPIEDPDALPMALEHAVAAVDDGRPALVDVVCAPR